MSWSDFIRTETESAASGEHSNKQETNGHDAGGGLHLIRLADMRPRLADGYLVKGLLGSTAMAVIFGESGSTKTFFSTYFGLCVASGIEFFKHRVRQAGVVYVAVEAGRGIENRVVAAKQELH